MLGLFVSLWQIVITQQNLGPATGTGTMDFSLAGGDDTGLLALLEDI